MTTLTIQQTADYLRKAGFAEKDVPNMVLAATLESGRVVERVGGPNRDGTFDRGVWQINDVHGYDKARLVSDPLYNAQAAKAIKDSQGFTAWTVLKPEFSLDPDNRKRVTDAANEIKDTGLGENGFLGTGINIGVGGVDLEDAEDALEGIGSGVGNAVGNTLNPFDGIISVALKILGNLASAEFWKRIGIGVAGFVLVVFMLVIMLSSQSPARAIKNLGK